MAKYIDAEKLKDEIKRMFTENTPYCNVQERTGAHIALSRLRHFINSLQQEQTRIADVSKMEDNTIHVEHGWVARDDDATLAFFATKPSRACYTRDRLYFEDELEEDMIPWVWANKKDEAEECIVLPSTIFPQLTWKDEPIEVELLIRKL